MSASPLMRFLWVSVKVLCSFSVPVGGSATRFDEAGWVVKSERIRASASRCAVPEVVLCRSNLDAVLCPAIDTATGCETPARTMFRTAVRRRS